MTTVLVSFVVTVAVVGGFISLLTKVMRS